MSNLSDLQKFIAYLPIVLAAVGIVLSFLLKRKAPKTEVSEDFEYPEIRSDRRYTVEEPTVGYHLGKVPHSRGGDDDKGRAAGKVQISEWSPQLIVMILFSAMVLLSALYVILTKDYDDSTKKWAFGAVGTVFGYWSRGTK